MVDELELCEKMALVRNRGSHNARELGQEVERLSDWREHVRAYPVPLALASLALGYFIVPARRADIKAPTSMSDRSVPFTGDRATVQEVKASGARGLGVAAMGFVGSLVANAVRGYISEQVHTLINPRGQHVKSNER